MYNVPLDILKTFVSTCVASPCDTNDGQHYVQEKSHSEKSPKKSDS